MAMRAGALNKRARFLALTRADDGGGGATETWSDFLTVWAQYSPERGRERIEAGRIDSQAAGVLRIRFSIAARQIGPGHRVVIDGVTYRITAPPTNPDGRGVMLEMTVSTHGL